jgi:hypothetical protein
VCVLTITKKIDVLYSAGYCALLVLSCGLYCSAITVGCECFHCGLHCLVGYCEAAGPKRLVGGTPPRAADT